MKDILFIVKTFALSIVIVLMLQIEYRDRTLETHAKIWLHTSPIAAHIDSAARGAAKMIRDARVKIESKFRRQKNTTTDLP